MQYLRMVHGNLVAKYNLGCQPLIIGKTTKVYLTTPNEHWSRSTAGCKGGEGGKGEGGGGKREGGNGKLLFKATEIAAPVFLHRLTPLPSHRCRPRLRLLVGPSLGWN